MVLGLLTTAGLFSMILNRTGRELGKTDLLFFKCTWHVFQCMSHTYIWYYVHIYGRCVFYVYMYTHTYINNNIERKKVLLIWGNKEVIREKRLGINWRQKRERGKRCNYSLN